MVVAAQGSVPSCIQGLPWLRPRRTAAATRSSRAGPTVKLLSKRVDCPGKGICYVCAHSPPPQATLNFGSIRGQPSRICPATPKQVSLVGAITHTQGLPFGPCLTAIVAGHCRCRTEQSDGGLPRACAPVRVVSSQRVSSWQPAPVLAAPRGGWWRSTPCMPVHHIAYVHWSTSA